MIYIALLLSSIAVTVWLLAYSWRRRNAPGLTTFSLMMLASAFWQSAITLMLLSPTTSMAVFWSRSVFIAASASPILLFVFIAQYSGSRLITPAKLIGLILVMVLQITIFWLPAGEISMLQRANL